MSRPVRRSSLSDLRVHSGKLSLIAEPRLAAFGPPSAFTATSYEGIVLHGAKLGRTIGFPTANIAIADEQPAPGIYAVHVRLEDGRGRPGVAYFGSRPTVDGRGELLEVHLFHFSDDIYGSRLSVRLIAHIRGDVKFPSLELMTAQMERDRAAAIKILEACPSCGS